MLQTASVPVRTSFSSAIKTILLSGFVAGTLDILGAFTVYGYIIANVPAFRVLQAVAAGVYGNTAFTGGSAMAAYGLLFHYCIALFFSVVYFFAFSKLASLRKYPVAGGVVYGVVVWCIMNLVVLPASNAAAQPFQWSSFMWSVGLIVFFVGLPIALVTHYRYARKKGLV